MQESEIQKLLRLKRHEQPDAEYFENFLLEFHHRQRTELARQPLWRLVADRMSAHFQGVSIPRAAFAGAFALFAAFMGIRFVGESLESAPSAPSLAAVLAPSATPAVPNLSPHGPGTTLAEQPSGFRPVIYEAVDAELPMRYVLDSRPASYETSLRF